MDYPNIFQIEDDCGLTILQRSIYRYKIPVFDFLLSLDDYPINAPNSEGTTALDVATSFFCNTTRNPDAEYFVYSLIKKSVNIDDFHRKTLLLHHALNQNCLQLAELLLEKGVDVNCQDVIREQTPLHVVHHSQGDKNELFAMLLCFGADPSIPDCEGYKPIDFAFFGGYLSESMQEHLLFYVFDDYCQGYDVPIERFFNLLESDSPLVPQLLKHITSVNFDNIPCCRSFDTYFMKLFIIKAEYLKSLLEKFDHVIENVINGPLDDNIINYNFWKEMCIENFDLLLESRFGSDVIEIIRKTRICTFITTLQNLRIPRSELFNLILVMLSYGADIYDVDIEEIYKVYGDCDFFRTLLHMDIKMSRKIQQCDLMLGLLYNVRIMENETFLSYPYLRQCRCSLRVLDQLLNYFAHPELKRYCDYYLSYILCFHDDYYHVVSEKTRNFPPVPLLVELARNELRKFLIKKYKIKNSMQFYTLIKHLPINKVHEKILTLETKLY